MSNYWGFPTAMVISESHGSKSTKVNKTFAVIYGVTHVKRALTPKPKARYF